MLLRFGPRGRLTRQAAWGWLISNAALPGSGSLMAGRASGYAQVALALCGMVVSTIFGLQFILWQAANWSQFHSADAEPLERLHEMWLHLKWALLGFGIFAVAWFWALGSSLAILRLGRADKE